MAATQRTKKKPARLTDRRNIWLLIITTLLVLGSVFMFTPPQEKINQGLDIQGGLSVVLTAKGADGAAVSNDDMEKSRAIIESRVNALGASEAVVQVQGTDQILVQIPGLTNTEDALNTIGKTGKLEFARLDSFTDEDVKTKIENSEYAGEGRVRRFRRAHAAVGARRSTSRWKTARIRPSSPARTSRRWTSASPPRLPPTTP